jgi:hypothetical protein
VEVWPHRFRHHFSHTWLERGGPEGDLMELNGWSSPQMLARYGASARSARARRTYDRIMTDNPYPPRASDSPLPPCAIAQRTPARDPPLGAVPWSVK